MPDFNRLNELVKRLYDLTLPQNQETGLVYWAMLTGETWKEIVDMWKVENFRNLTEYAKIVHEANKKWWVCLACNEKGLVRGYNQEGDGFYYISCDKCEGTKILKRNVGEMIALMHSELSEALEGHRKGLKDDKLPQWDMVDVEMVDCLIRIMDVLGQKGVDVEKIFRDKMEFNRVREDHKLESRMKEGGKKY